MLRISDFCRSPLSSPLPKIRRRRRRNNESQSSYSLDFSDAEEDEEEVFVPVTVQVLPSSSSSSPGRYQHESSIVRVPLEVLKGLSLRDGDYAFIEEEEIDTDVVVIKTRRRRRQSRRKNVIVRLELMDEEEEENEIITKKQKSCNNNCTSTICVVVPSIVLTNLGLPPQAYWNNNCNEKDDNNYTKTSFRLRAIYDGDDEVDDDDTVRSSTSIGQEYFTNRKRIATHVLLRPLGRSVRWPCFSLSRHQKTTSLSPNSTNHEKSTKQIDDNEDDDTNDDKNIADSITSDKDNSNKKNLKNEKQHSHNDDHNKNGKNSYSEDGNDNDDDNDTWIFPSRSGILLQESMLFEVRYHDNENDDNNSDTGDDNDNEKKKNKKKIKVCYYEVLKIRSKEEDDVNIVSQKIGDKDKDDEIIDTNDEYTDSNDENEDEDEDEDDVFYVTSSCTQFGFDSESISSLPFVRRLPPPPPSSSSSSLTIKNLSSSSSQCSSNDNSATKTDTQNCQQQQIQLDQTKGEIPVTPRRLFTVPKSPDNDNDANIVDNSVTDGYYDDDVPHPNWKVVAQALIHAPHTSSASAGSSNNHPSSSPSIATSTQILHVIGTDRDHHLRTCVETAAHRIGMRCISIRGLAAFGYEYRRSNDDDNINTTPQVTVGSTMIEQQIAGIDCSLEYVRRNRMEPCVLHFYDIDDELNSCVAVGDDVLRCQIEDRFWTKWMEILTPTPPSTKESGAELQSSRSSEERRYFDREDHRSLDYRYTPRIIIVISTTKPLKKGPWLERLIFPSISLSSPDDRYIQYLWNQEHHLDDDSVNVKDDENLTASSSTANATRQINKEIMTLLRGRPAEEIVQLRQKMLAVVDNGGSSRGGSIDGGGDSTAKQDDIDDGISQVRDTQAHHHLKELCQELDTSRRKSSSAISNISNVSWADVGGLDHVRAEIMDAIELPLKYPQLFPQNAGRSGILLFGPPGVGKTLVAKAVATECGLPFMSVKGPELLGSYVGESEANIRNVFETARRAASTNLPIAASVLFFDEMDSLAPRRDGGGMNNGGGVMERVVASLLAELDGTNNNNNNSSGDKQKPQGRVFVLGATNRPDLLDPSLLRPGRLDRLVYLGIPTDHKERTRILASQLRKMKLEYDDDVDDDDDDDDGTSSAEKMASLIVEKLPPRLSGADMSKLSSGAMLHSLRRLCRRAEQEREQQQSSSSSGKIITVDEILKNWDEKKCTPVITYEDLLEASKDILPSVSEEEMERYERLRIEHGT
jgi:SpoVK/Ycf46/Vps4 family AAA+-type ATPase